MNEQTFSNILIASQERIKAAEQYEQKRYLYDTLAKAPRNFFVGVCGLRGIGKTVLLLQLAGQMKNSLYVSADASYLSNIGLYELIRFCSQRGYKDLFIDEIQYKEGWQQALKTAYDEGLARVYFSGSSALELKEGADLSRRALLFRLQPLSLREHLALKHGFGAVAPISPETLFDHAKRKEAILHTKTAHSFLGDYYRHGGVAYSGTEEPYFSQALENLLEKIIHADLAYLREMNLAVENDVRRVLQWIAISPPGEISYSSLSSKISLSKPTLMRIIDDLTKIGLINRVLPCGKGLVRKEPKLYLAFPFRKFLAKSAGMEADIGALREEFFASHAQEICYLKGRRGQKTPDFAYNGKIIEVGGTGKNFSQKPDFVVRDDVTFEEKSIPLYLCGFLY